MNKDTTKTGNGYEAGDYAAHQRKADRAYALDYSAWIAGLSPEEVFNLRRLDPGLLAPELPTISGAVEDKGANRTEAAEAEEPDEDKADALPEYDEDGAELEIEGEREVEAAAETPEEKTALKAQRELFGICLRRLVGEILAQRNRSLAAEAVSLVTGVAYMGASEAAIARRFGITRAAVSKRCVELCGRLGVQPSRAMMQKWKTYMREESAESIAADLERLDNVDATGAPVDSRA